MYFLKKEVKPADFILILTQCCQYLHAFFLNILNSLNRLHVMPDTILCILHENPQLFSMNYTIFCNLFFLKFPMLLAEPSLSMDASLLSNNSRTIFQWSSASIVYACICDLIDQKDLKVAVLRTGHFKVLRSRFVLANKQIDIKNMSVLFANHNILFIVYFFKRC